MNEGKSIVVVPPGFDEKFDLAIRRGASPEEVMEILTIDYLKSKAQREGRNFVKITDGETTLQILVHSKTKEQPKKP